MQVNALIVTVTQFL